MTLISKPDSLTRNATSDAQHISDFYNQLSDGNHDIKVANLFCGSIDISNSASVSSFKNQTVIIYSIQLINNGSLNSSYINSTMIDNGYNPNDYENQIMLVYSSDESFNNQLIMSIRVSVSLCQWIIISNQGNNWNHVSV